MKALAVVALLAAGPNESLPLTEWHAPGFVAKHARDATALLGHVRSRSHQQSIVNATAVSEARLRRHILLPDWWEAATVEAVAALSALTSGELRMSRDRVSVTGIAASAPASLDALREVLPDDVELDVAVVVVSDEDIQAVCDRLFATLDERPLLFDRASSAIRSGDYGRLNQTAAALRRCPTIRLAVDGHSDAFGTRSGNQRMSEERAASVRAFLVARGVAAERIETRAFGATQPAATNDTWAGRNLNRRVEVRRLN